MYRRFIEGYTMLTNSLCSCRNTRLWVCERRLSCMSLAAFCAKLKFDCHFRSIRTGDLTSNVSDNGIGELHSKRVARQIAAALEFVHQKYGQPLLNASQSLLNDSFACRDICHRDVKLDNILVFRSDFSRVKLCDFGESKKVNTMVQRRNEWLPYTAPEIISTETDDTYK